MPDFAHKSIFSPAATLPACPRRKYRASRQRETVAGGSLATVDFSFPGLFAEALCHDRAANEPGA
jgi:hypothetical protein